MLELTMKEVMKMTVGERIKSKREQMDLQQKDLARLAELSASFVSDVENGKKNISLPSLEKIAKVLGCTSAELLGGENVSNAIPDDLLEHLELLKLRPELKALLKTGSKVTKKDIEFVIEYLKFKDK